MVDVFVVAILVGVVQLGSVMTIHPGEGALAFAGVVILTMLAAMSFDPRLIWDAAAREGTRERNNRRPLPRRSTCSFRMPESAHPTRPPPRHPAPPTRLPSRRSPGPAAATGSRRCGSSRWWPRCWACG